MPPAEAILLFPFSAWCWPLWEYRFTGISGNGLCDENPYFCMMTVNVLAFGIAKDIFGKSSISIAVDGSTTSDLKNALEQQYPRLKQLVSYMVAVNSEYASDEIALNERDEIAIIPPVSGG
jgi:molybdopterin synthase sulfur carrier subunit